MDKTIEKVRRIRDLLHDFEQGTSSATLRDRVLSLVPIFGELRELGKILVPHGLKLSARDRILVYFQKYPLKSLNEREIAIVAGISEWARRIRELRVQFGWNIISGLTAAQMRNEEEIEQKETELLNMRVNDYMLIDVEQDRDAAFRWNIANSIRKRKIGGREKILEYLRANVGKTVTGEELSYVANASEWARRVRELRTEDGWPIVSRLSGNPDLPIGVYVLEQDRQTPQHDRKIPEPVRRQALRRDQYKCQKCGWSHELYNRSDPRFLELHHIQHHVNKGPNVLENLTTLCNICHDELHRATNSLNKN